MDLSRGSRVKAFLGRCARIVCRKPEPPNPFSHFGEGHEGIVAVEQNLCGWDETRECCNRWSVGSIGDIVMVAFELYSIPLCVISAMFLGPYWCVRPSSIGTLPGAGKDETNVPESRKMFR